MTTLGLCVFVRTCRSPFFCLSAHVSGKNEHMHMYSAQCIVHSALCSFLGFSRKFHGSWLAFFSCKLKITISRMYLFYKETFSLIFQSTLHMNAHYRTQNEYFPVNFSIIGYLCVIRCKKTTFPICFNREQPLKVFILQAVHGYCLK